MSACSLLSSAISLLDELLGVLFSSVGGTLGLSTEKDVLKAVRALLPEERDHENLKGETAVKLEATDTVSATQMEASGTGAWADVFRGRLENTCKAVQVGDTHFTPARGMMVQSTCVIATGGCTPRPR